MTPFTECSRLEWAEWRQDHWDAFRESNYIPRSWEAMRKEARRILVRELVKERKGQTRLEEF